MAAPVGPMEREPIAQPMPTGIRAIDSVLTCGRGQRMVFSVAAASARVRCSVHSLDIMERMSP
jgi:flagellar biosynthesis/type III secretory pathway ATPase